MAFLPRIRALRPIAPLLMALALFARMIVPAGFMPVQGTDGVTRILMCSGSGPMSIASPVAFQGKADHHSGDQGSHEGDHACAFAGFAAVADFAHAPAPLAPVFVAVAPMRAAALFVRPGLGLAAPPPPKTGPPVTLR